MKITLIRPSRLFSRKSFSSAAFTNDPQCRTVEVDSEPISVIYIFVGFECQSDRRLDLSSVGDKCKSILITQPALTRMELYLSCKRHGIWGPAGGDLTSPTGLTLGDLYARAKEILQENFACPVCNEKHESGTREDKISVKGYEMMDGIAFASGAPHSYLRDTNTNF